MFNYASSLIYMERCLLLELVYDILLWIS